MLAMKWAPQWITLIVLCAAPPARADTRVNTENQQAGVAPRLEFELGPEFAVGLGSACRPRDTGRHCISAMALPGGSFHLLLRPFNHFALGASAAYDVRFGAHHVTVGGTREAYALSGMRFGAELRWYSRRVVAGGFFAALQAGVIVWNDTWSRSNGSDAKASQTAPLFGFELGGAFIPYGGIGLTVAAQARLALFSSDPKDLSHWSGEKTFGYGPLVFIGLAWRLAYGVSF